MFNILGIAGSPRKKGNSTTLMKEALAGAESVGGRSEIVYLNDLTFKGCQGCQICSPKNECIIKDALTPVFSAMSLADAWILASPIYYDYVSGQMKLFFDRCRWLTRGDERLWPKLKGKRTAGIILTWEDGPNENYVNVAGIFNTYLNWISDFGIAEVLAVPNMGKPDTAARNKKLLAQARDMGKKLAELA